MTATLLNVFIVPEDQEAAFLQSWKETAELYSKNPGFIDAHLHRNTGVGTKIFNYINIAHWESSEAWRTAHGTFPPGAYDLPGVKAHPAIYESIIDVELPVKK